ncbi:GNAT family N-acetyltransferase [Sphingobium sp. EP60837]|uniref:GNAT family N-acetyltransferase n=1 Tax=Sphingobium sp. EP60837 TaxID=1855519 RepID=UPI0007DDCCF0|nr:GNAT family N-acetyltransferase [Sphingobium sp. EP60837]ANI79411.1 hypothetical protein EP837_03017 [Sphingobium sp. EP60837]
MDDRTIGEKLRGMAEHRGLKLVKSRRRKPGTGDYGKFGLTDATGKALLGIGDDGLTASATEVEEYLRAGAANTWKASADATPARPAKPAPGAKAKDAKDRDADTPPPTRIARRGGARPAGDRLGREQDPEKIAELKSRQGRPMRERAAEPGSTRVGPARAKPEQTPTPKPEPKLAIRVARSGDAAALARLLDQLTHIEIDELAIARNLAAVQQAKGGMLVAELGALVGCCGWALVPTVQHGEVGRITMLLVDANHRRRRIGSAMLEAAMTALREAGCTMVEVMSDIEIAHSHGFFRGLKFEQTSYRFSRAIGAPS